MLTRHCGGRGKPSSRRGPSVDCQLLVEMQRLRVHICKPLPLPSVYPDQCCSPRACPHCTLTPMPSSWQALDAGWWKWAARSSKVMSLHSSVHGKGWTRWLPIGLWATATNTPCKAAGSCRSLECKALHVAPLPWHNSYGWVILSNCFGVTHLVYTPCRQERSECRKRVSASLAGKGMQW